MIIRTPVVAFLLLSMLCCSATASAQEDVRPSTDTDPEPLALTDDSALEWEEGYEKFRWWEYPTTVGLSVGGLGLRYFGPDPPANWDGPVLFDEPIMNGVQVTGYRTRSTWDKISDVGYYGSMAYRILENTLVVGVGHGRWDIGWQMFWMDLQALSAISSTLWGGQALVGRKRPAVVGCTSEVRAGAYCGEDNEDRRRSWYAGHPAVAMTLAGTTCVHHAKLNIYSPVGAAITCGTVVTGAVVTGVARVVAGAHYPTDLAAGWLLGAAAGWGLPLALHYGLGKERDVPVAISPTAGPDSAGIVARGLF